MTLLINVSGNIYPVPHEIIMIPFGKQAFLLKSLRFHGVQNS